MKALRVIRIIALLIVIVVLGGVLVFGIRNGGINWGKVAFGNSADATLIKTQTESLQGIGNIELAFTYHELNVYQGDGDSIRVEQYDSKDVAEDEQFTVQRTGDTLWIGVKKTNRVFTIFGPYVCRVDVYLPASYASNVNAATTSGSLKVDAAFTWADTVLASNSGSVRCEYPIIAKDLSATATSGSVRLSNVTAASLVSRANSGSVHIDGVTATGDVEVTTTSGSVNADQLMGANVTATSNSGSVNVAATSATGDVRMSTTSGSVRAESIMAGGVARLGSNSGSLRIGALSCKVFEMSTSSGGITVESLIGSGTAQASSGSVRVTLEELTGDASFAASSGSVNIGVGSKASFLFKATNSSGGIHASYPLTVDKEHDKEGTVGSNPQHTVELRSSSGTIRLGS